MAKRRVAKSQSFDYQGDNQKENTQQFLDYQVNVKL